MAALLALEKEGDDADEEKINIGEHIFEQLCDAIRLCFTNDMVQNKREFRGAEAAQNHFDNLRFGNPRDGTDELKIEFVVAQHLPLLLEYYYLLTNIF